MFAIGPTCVLPVCLSLALVDAHFTFCSIPPYQGSDAVVGGEICLLPLAYQEKSRTLLTRHGSALKGLGARLEPVSRLIGLPLCVTHFS